MMASKAMILHRQPSMTRRALMKSLALGALAP